MSDADSSFLSRWSRRKAAVREGQPVPAEPVLAPDAAPVAVTVAKVPTAPDPIPLDVLRRLTQSETLGLFDPIEDEERQGEKEEEGEVAADPKALEAPPSPPSPEAEVAQAQPQPDAPADDTPIPPLPADKRA